MLGKLKALAAGVVLGILLAPRSGRDSRRLIIDWINDFFASGTRRFQELEEELDRRRGRSEAPDWDAEGVAEGEEPLP